MSKGDTQNQRPSVEDEMAKFQGFSTLDGEDADGEATPEEKAALAAREQRAKENEDSGESDSADEKEDSADESGAADNEDESAEDDEDESAESDEADEDDEESEDAKKTHEQQKKQKPYHRTAKGRVEAALKAQRLAERETAIERASRLELEQRIAKLEQGLTPERSDTKQEDDAAPKPEDFEYGELDVKYIKAVARHEIRQEMKAEQAKTNKARQDDAAQREAVEVAEKVKTLEKVGTEKYDDFDEVVTQARQLPPTDPDFWPCSETLGKLILGSDIGADVAYHLASNPKEARQVFGKSPMEQAAYFGRLEAKFASASAAKSKETDPNKGKNPATKTTKAPRPPEHRPRGAGGNSPASASTTDFKQFESMAMGSSKH